VVQDWWEVRNRRTRSLSPRAVASTDTTHVPIFSLKYRMEKEAALEKCSTLHKVKKRKPIPQENVFATSVSLTLTV
jgi:hypothetical protein